MPEGLRQENPLHAASCLLVWKSSASRVYSTFSLSEDPSGSLPDHRPRLGLEQPKYLHLIISSSPGRTLRRDPPVSELSTQLEKPGCTDRLASALASVAWVDPSMCCQRLHAPCWAGFLEIFKGASCWVVGFGKAIYKDLLQGLSMHPSGILGLCFSTACRKEEVLL